MQTQFTHEFMKENCGCYSEVNLMKCSFMKNDKVTLDSILQSEISLKDKFWFVCKRLATKSENQQIAISVAELVLPIYEKRYHNDLRPREAIKAAKDYINGHITLDELRLKRDAVAAYADAVYAADAAYADAAAAAAAYAAAAYADAYAAAAAAYAAAAYAAAAYADAYADAAAAYAADAAYAAYAAYAAATAAADQLLDFLINFCNTCK